ncbi:TIGR03546 family protein [Oceanispirochaeta crateris]|uniref:TIGR03546 family protein n=1 Tax=Oceanispirochaeta crateris TaxID=2518645 RepID=A0A5C1QPQ9_9SPIO|nr:TIGR03546 family protein [Oceanispirochaeta crateris]QEN09010.1 TIGR03546 family protein [Oceanispirochaeta crateris]
MISFIAKILVSLNSNSRPGELSSGIAFGFTLALIPGGNLLWVAVFAIAFLIKHHLGAMLLSILLFKPLAPLLDPLLHMTGEFILTLPSLRGLFTTLYNLPLLPWFRINNTVVLGALVWSLILWLPIFIVFRLLVVLYRNKVASKLANSKLIKAFKKVPLVSKISSTYRKFNFLT